MLVLKAKKSSHRISDLSGKRDLGGHALSASLSHPLCWSRCLRWRTRRLELWGSCSGPPACLWDVALGAPKRGPTRGRGRGQSSLGFCQGQGEGGGDDGTEEMSNVCLGASTGEAFT